MSRGNLIRAIHIWAYGNAQRIAQLETWQTEALENLAEGKGGHYTSASMNGIAFTMTAGKITNADWFGILTEVLYLINNSASPAPSIIRGIIEK